MCVIRFITFKSLFWTNRADDTITHRLKMETAVFLNSVTVSELGLSRRIGIPCVQSVTRALEMYTGGRFVQVCFRIHASGN